MGYISVGYKLRRLYDFNKRPSLSGSSYFLAIAHSYGKVGTKPMLVAAYDYNPIASASGLLSALFGMESCENACFSGFSGGFCLTFTDSVCIKDSVGIEKKL